MRHRVLVFAGVLLALAPPASARAAGGDAPPSAEQLEQARKTFSDGLKDEQAQRFQVALEKFRAVQRVRDTAPVRYRIATCLDGLGRLVEARDAYLAAADVGASDDTQSKLVKASRDRAAELSARIGAVVVRLEPEAADARILVDGQAVSRERITAASGLPLDPGRHVVTASAPGTTTFQGEVTLPEGGVVALRATLTPEGQGAVAPPPLPADTAGPSMAAARGGRPSSAPKVLGWTLVGVGSAAAVSGAICLGLRESYAQTIVAACPGGLCDPTRQAELLSKRDQASVLGPLGGALLAGGLVAAGAGVYLLLSSASSPSAPPPSPKAFVAPLWVSGPGLVVGGSL